MTGWKKSICLTHDKTLKKILSCFPVKITRGVWRLYVTDITRIKVITQRYSRSHLRSKPPPQNTGTEKPMMDFTSAKTALFVTVAQAIQIRVNSLKKKKDENSHPCVFTEVLSFHLRDIEPSWIYSTPTLQRTGDVSLSSMASIYLHKVKMNHTANKAPRDPCWRHFPVTYSCIRPTNDPHTC